MRKTDNLSGVIAIIAGTLILLFPQILTIAVGLYLIVTGLLAVMNKK